jgi:ABC-type nitrate/sulfonate/bicarbonate transport system ATPase subunit
MFQKDLLFPWRNVLDNAALGLEVASGDRSQARHRARELLPRFGLEGFEAHQPSELSGGMRQRVALLRTLLLQRPLLLLDEPFAALDALTRRELQAWLRGTWRLGSEAAVLVTHDVREAVLLSDRVYVMSPRPGRIVAEIAVERGPDGLADPLRAARAEEAVLQALQVDHLAV